MGLVRKSVIGAAGLVACVTAASAADVPGNRPVDLPVPTYRPVAQPLTGWYLRGDLGYRWGRVSGSTTTAPFASPGSEKLGQSFFGGVGVGLKSDWLRTDGTIDIGAPMKYESTTVTANDTSAKISTITALFNGYLDLGSWYNATPYIGAGVGAARLRVSDYQSTVAPPFTGDASRSQWNFAWAAMGGVAYKAAPNMQIDVGYRYLALGNVSTAGDLTGNTTIKNIANHEIRVGLRWSIDDLPVAR